MLFMLTKLQLNYMSYLLTLFLVIRKEVLM